MNIEKLIDKLEEFGVLQTKKIKLEKKEKLYMFYTKNYKKDFVLEFSTTKKDVFVEALNNMVGGNKSENKII